MKYYKEIKSVFEKYGFKCKKESIDEGDVLTVWSNDKYIALCRLENIEAKTVSVLLYDKSVKKELKERLKEHDYELESLEDITSELGTPIGRIDNLFYLNIDQMLLMHS